MCLHAGGSKNLGDAAALPPWDGGQADGAEICPSPPVLSCQLSSYINVTSVITELLAFQSRSRLIKRKRIDRIPVTY